MKVCTWNICDFILTVYFVLIRASATSRQIIMIISIIIIIIIIITLLLERQAG
jgi:hypothetical protein